MGTVLNDNTTNVALGASGTFVGTAESTTGFSIITVNVLSDQGSAIPGLFVEFSSDGLSWPVVVPYVYTAGQDFKRSVVVADVFFRVRYVNGALAQTTFSLQSFGYAASTGNVTMEQEQAVLETFRISSSATSVGLCHRSDFCFSETTKTVGTGSVVEANGLAFLAASANGDRAVIQARAKGSYSPNTKSRFMGSAILNAKTGGNDADTAVLYGFFSDSDGCFVRIDGNGSSGLVSLTIRGSGTGFLSETTVAQADWNIDKLDGTGNSGFVLDTRDRLSFYIEMDWAFVGRVRCAFIVNGAPLYCHEFVASNTVSIPLVSTRRFPVRLELQSSGGVAQAVHNASFYYTEASSLYYPTVARRFSVASPSPVTLVVGTAVPLLSLKPKSTATSGVRLVRLQSAFPNSGVLVAVRLWFYVSTDPSSVLTGASFANASSESDVEYDSSATAFTQGTGRELVGEWTTGLQTFTVSETEEGGIVDLEVDVNDVPDLVVVTMEQVSGTPVQAVVGINWLET